MTRLFLTCEHGGNEVPPPFDTYFKGARKVLASHRGWDPGALDLLQHLEPLADTTLSATLSRLVIELNRSAHHPGLFSTYSDAFPKAWKQGLIDGYYQAYRKGFEKEVRAAIAEGDTVLHLSMHSFTPELDGKVRVADIGLLYDPQRTGEKRFCQELRDALVVRAPGLRVRMNYPYRGTSDGFTTALRRVFTKGYRGIEVEVNQRFAGKKGMHPDIKALFQGALGALGKN
jgi:predicted N-formylglutamate amidohydrolase